MRRCAPDSRLPPLGGFLDLFPRNWRGWWNIGLIEELQVHCMAVAPRRLSTPDAESVDQLAQVEQIPSLPRSCTGSSASIGGVSPSGAPFQSVQPAGNQRLTAIQQDCKEMVDAAPPNGVDHRQRPIFECVTLVPDRHRFAFVRFSGPDLTGSRPAFRDAHHYRSLR